MKIRVNKSLKSVQALFKANVPSSVIEHILGHEFTANENFEISVPWHDGKLVTWELPAESVTILVN